jgi:multisubunit Na+/H+ antiporter MnhB subunit
MIAADLLLAAALVALAAASLLVRAPGTGSVLFIAFGLLLALAWVRLGAADVALAEAAIGAGVAGALLLDAAAQFGRGAQASAPGTTDRIARGDATHTRARTRLGLSTLAVVVLSAAFGAALLYAALAVDPVSGAATRGVTASLTNAEIVHPVTAVLLAFRAYDTLLEIAVLLVAVIAAQAAPPAARAPLPRDPVLARVAGLTVPLAVLVAVYLLWAGATRTGGAFQAGAVLAGALLLARFSSLPLDAQSGWARPALLALGLAVFIAVGLAAGAAAGAVLAYPQGWAGALVLAIEAALMVSIAAALVALFGWRER